MFRDDYSYLYEKADYYVQAERKQFSNVYKIIDNYICEQQIIIGGQMATNLLHGDDNHENYYYDLFSSKSFAHSINLSNIITEKLPKRIVRLVSVSPYKLYQIYIDTRLLVSINEITSRAGINYLKLVDPMTKKLRKKSVLVNSPEIQLLILYRRLYSPGNSDSWEKDLDNERKLFSIVLSRKYNIFGGLDSLKRTKIEAHLLNYVVKTNKILIGEHACQILLGIKSEANFIEAISDQPVNEKEIKDLVHNTVELPVSFQTLNLDIIGDYRLERTTVKVDDKDVMYIYNCASYDLIPYNIVESRKRTLKVGNPFVILRFLLVNLWIIRRVKELGYIDEKFANLRLKTIFNLVVEMRKALLPEGELLGTSSAIREDLIGSNDILAVFQTYNYIGTYIPDELSFKMERQEKKTKHADYYPIIYKNLYGSYREPIF